MAGGGKGIGSLLKFGRTNNLRLLSVLMISSGLGEGAQSLDTADLRGDERVGQGILFFQILKLGLSCHPLTPTLPGARIPCICTFSGVQLRTPCHSHSSRGGWLLCVPRLQCGAGWKHLEGKGRGSLRSMTRESWGINSPASLPLGGTTHRCVDSEPKGSPVAEPQLHTVAPTPQHTLNQLPPCPSASWDHDPH